MAEAAEARSWVIGLCLIQVWAAPGRVPGSDEAHITMCAAHMLVTWAWDLQACWRTVRLA